MGAEHNEPLSAASPVTAALLSSVQEAAAGRLVPLNVTMELTLACNIRCLHCYNLDRDDPAAARNCSGSHDPAVPPPLTLVEVKRVLREVADAGCLFLSLTGGEIFSYPHLFEVLHEARALHLSVQLLTNGTLLRPGVVGRLATYRNLLGISVSLYGATAETHDAITQVAGSYRRTWDGIRRLRRQGLAVRLKFIVMQQNAHEASIMIGSARSEGLPYMVDLTITRRHDGSEGSLICRVEPAQLEALYRGPLADMVPSGAFEADQWACNCARGNCAITANGDVQPCISVPLKAGNVRTQSFREIWNNSALFNHIRGLSLRDFDSCAPCEDKGFCPRSRGAAVTASGSYTGIDPFLCEVAGVVRKVASRKNP